jgi:hypothetical protein
MAKRIRPEAIEPDLTAQPSHARHNVATDSQMAAWRAAMALSAAASGVIAAKQWPDRSAGPHLPQCLRERLIGPGARDAGVAVDGVARHSRHAQRPRLVVGGADLVAVAAVHRTARRAGRVVDQAITRGYAPGDTDKIQVGVLDHWRDGRIRRMRDVPPLAKVVR